MAGLYPRVRKAACDQSGEDGVARAWPRVGPALTRGGDPGPGVEHRPPRGTQQRGQVEHLVHHHVLSVDQLNWFIKKIYGMKLYIVKFLSPPGLTP